MAYSMILVMLILAIALLLPHHYEKIPLTKELCFGMKPVEVRLAYGKPDTAHSSDISDSIIYTYQVRDGGYMIEIHLSFVRVHLHHELSEASFLFLDIPVDHIIPLKEDLIEQCREAFSCNTGCYEQEDGVATTLEINKNAVILYLRFEASNSGVRVDMSRIY